MKHLFYLQVDNPLVPIADPEFIGYHLLAESELTSMAVAKQAPDDKLGNFVAVDGHVQVIEYSDFPLRRGRAARRRRFAHVLGREHRRACVCGRLPRAGAAAARTPCRFTSPTRKCRMSTRAGRRVEPTQPNALKFERFIFDLLPHAANAIVVEYPEREVFAPLKNAPGAERDTPEYVRRADGRSASPLA